MVASACASRQRSLAATSPCTLYRVGAGCVAHAARPLACRLFPLGRNRNGERTFYGYDGPVFPCRVGCPRVDQLPAQTVGAYLAGQDVGEGEAVADAYVELVQDLAEGALRDHRRR